jgi:subtilisin family serine protease
MLRSVQTKPVMSRLRAMGLVLGLLLAIGTLGAASARPMDELSGASASRSTSVEALVDIGPEVLAAFDKADPVAVIVHLRDERADRRLGLDTSTEAQDQTIQALQRDALGALQAGDLELTHRYKHIPAFAGKLSREGLALLAQAPGVAGVSADPVVRALLDDSTRYIGTDRLRRQGKAGAGVRIAVLDTGIDSDHIDLRDALVDQMCTLVPRDRCGPEPNIAEDVDGHGTHVAGIVASRGKRAPHGVAAESEIVAVKFLEERNSGAGSNFIEAIDALISRGDIDVVNMSLGTNLLYSGICDDETAYTRALTAAFKRLRDTGAMPVAASGNAGSPNKMGAPACISHVISVGAIALDPRPAIAEFTNRSGFLDLLAPGVAIESSEIRGSSGERQGTSMAAPHVAGAIAVLKSEYPWAPLDLIVQVLKDTGQRPTVRLEGNEAKTIKVDKALTELGKITPTETPELPTETPSPTATETPEPSETPSVTDTPEPSETPVEPTPTQTERSVIPTAEPWAPDPVYLPKLARP